MNKAFHIDDTFHLEAAEYFIENPSKPMSGMINWEDDPTPISSHNQPPILFFMIAAIMKIFGTNEYTLHLFFSIFTFLSLYYFQKTAQLVSAQNAKILLLLFAFNPALIVNQNLMTDIPVLVSALGSLYYLLKGSATSKLYYYVVASLLLSMGLLIKYSVLPLIIVFMITILIKDGTKKLFVLLIPIGFLLLWSLWNFTEYGSIHIIDRPKSSFHINNILAFIACLGSISTFLPSFIYGSSPKKNVRMLIYISLSIVAVSVTTIYLGNFQEQYISMTASIIFLFAGLLAVLSLLFILWNHLKDNYLEFLRSEQFTIFLYLTSLSSFMVLFAPFSATRHILLILPFILLFGYTLIEKATHDINGVSIIITILLGLLLGISDWKYADYYREMAAVDLPKDKTTWTIGHWGWQWYAKQNGMEEYNTTLSSIREGDYFIYPADISKQKINNKYSLIIIEKKWQEANILTFFSGANFASMYNSYIDKPAWSLSKSPIDTIYYCKVVLRENDRIRENK